jgi:hypothetical protein
MNCETFQEQIFDFLQDGSDSPPFLGHRAACPACADLLRAIENNERALKEARIPRSPTDLWPRISAAIGQGRPIPFRIAAVAATLLLALALFFSAGPSPAPKFDLALQEVDLETQQLFHALVPRYEDVDTLPP